jgi:hypothetical protein
MFIVQRSTLERETHLKRHVEHSNDLCLVRLEDGHRLYRIVIGVEFDGGSHGRRLQLRGIP